MEHTTCLLGTCVKPKDGDNHRVPVVFQVPNPHRTMYIIKSASQTQVRALAEPAQNEVPQAGALDNSLEAGGLGSGVSRAGFSRGPSWTTDAASPVFVGGRLCRCALFSFS